MLIPRQGMEISRDNGSACLHEVCSAPAAYLLLPLELISKHAMSTHAPKKKKKKSLQTYHPLLRVTSSFRGHLFSLKNCVSEGTILALSCSYHCLIYQLIKNTARLHGADADDKRHQVAAHDRRSTRTLARLIGLSCPFLPIPGSTRNSQLCLIFLVAFRLLSLKSQWDFLFVFILFSGNASFSSLLLVKIGVLAMCPLQIQILAPLRKCVSRFPGVSFSEIISV